MITPVFIQVIFWLFAALAVIGGLIQMTNSVIGGLLIIILGPLFVRMYAEILIIIFRIHDAVRDIRDSKIGGSAPAPETAAPVAPPPAS